VTSPWYYIGILEFSGLWRRISPRCQILCCLQGRAYGPRRCQPATAVPRHRHSAAPCQYACTKLAPGSTIYPEITVPITAKAVSAQLGGPRRRDEIVVGYPSGPRRTRARPRRRRDRRACTKVAPGLRDSPRCDDCRTRPLLRRRQHICRVNSRTNGRRRDRGTSCHARPGSVCTPPASP
jgi:hypothetical protein